MGAEILKVVKEPLEFRYLMAAIAYLSHYDKLGDVLFQDSLAGTCSKCGEPYYFDEW
jgi:hypothetical protein